MKPSRIGSWRRWSTHILLADSIEELKHRGVPPLSFEENRGQTDSRVKSSVAAIPESPSKITMLQNLVRAEPVDNPNILNPIFKIRPWKDGFRFDDDSNPVKCCATKIPLFRLWF
jgi:hypothetical protein